MAKMVIKPEGDIVASMVNEFKKKLQNLILKEGATEIEIDLSNVEILDSVGLGAFIATHNTLQQRNGKLVVTNVSNDIFNLFKTMRIDQHFTILKK